MITLHVNYTGQHQELRVAEKDVITFPSGLVGCADWRRFALLTDEETPALNILQSLDEPTIHFLVTDPLLIEPGYRVNLTPDQLDRLNLAGPEAAVLLCILTAREDPPRVTANLLGPLVLNPAARLGLQLVLTDAPYTTQHPVPPRAQSEGEVASC